MGNNYAKFAAMIATSTAVMLVLMYLNTYQWDHVFFSETRFYMAFVMGASMAGIMLLFMLNMYRNRFANVRIIATSVAIFIGALWLVRSQETVEDLSWMKAMIPHHSIAILTSERAHIADPRVRKLADEIIEAQRRDDRRDEGADQGPGEAALTIAAGCDSEFSVSLPASHQTSTRSIPPAFAAFT